MKNENNTMKTYNTPKSESFEITTEYLIAASPANPSIKIDDNKSAWEGDAKQKGWGTPLWGDTEE